MESRRDFDDWTAQAYRFHDYLRARGWRSPVVRRGQGFVLVGMPWPALFDRMTGAVANDCDAERPGA